MASARCQFCGRKIRLYRHPERGVEFMAHRMPERTDWCAGGGQHPIHVVRTAPPADPTLEPPHLTLVTTKEEPV